MISIAAGLRVFREKPATTGWDPGSHCARLDCADEAPRIHAICCARRRLGECHHRDHGSAGAAGDCSPFHTNMAATVPADIAKAIKYGTPPPPNLSPDEQHAYDQLAFFFAHGLGYATEMANRPQTLYGIADSPVGLAAWILDHDERSYELIARVFDGKTEGLSRDDILENITLYWLTNTAVSSARLYWEYKGGFFDPRNVAIPVAVSVFPDEIYAAPRSWAERAYPKLLYFKKHDKGGHFAAWEQPSLFTEDVRATFRPLRSGV